MNKVFCRMKYIVSFILTGYFIFFNTSCGLDTFYVIDEPRNVVKAPVYSDINTDYFNKESENEFQFYTVDHDYDGVKFLGTEVYYRIYKDFNVLKNQVNRLITMASDEETSYNSPDTLIKSYNYQPLRASGHPEKDILIPAVGYNQLVEIRLSDFNNIYFAGIKVDGQNLYGDTNRVIPVRNVSNYYPFNFKDLDSDQVPSEDSTTNPDYDYSGSSTDNYLYVALFAVARGQEPTYAPIYSNILFLGVVAIPTK